MSTEKDKYPDVSIWYHGTTKENAESIMKEGFRKGTQFAQHLSTSIGFGGNYVFAVLFDEDP
jgi:RNA:NAD 2'-phosphotransferase (TPT1/KptA family)